MGDNGICPLSPILLSIIANLKLPNYNCQLLIAITTQSLLKRSRV